MDKFFAMSVFRAVAETGSFSKASEVLGLSTTTTSRQVAELEKSLGVALLYRSTRHVGLTDNGRLYIERCRQHLDDIADTEQMLSGDRASVRGTLRLSVPATFGRIFLMPHLAGFMKAYPELRLDVHFADRVVDLAGERVDLAIRICTAVHSGLIARPLTEIRKVLCASPAYLARHGTPTCPEDLRRHQCLLYTQTTEGDAWVLTRGGETLTLPLRGHLRTNNSEMLCQAAIDGHGILLEPSFICGNALRSGALQRILPDYEAVPRHVYAVFSGSSRQSGKIRAFVDYLVDCLPGQPPWDHDLPLAA